jgi:hypothetical protein
MLKLKINVCRPGFDSAGVLEDVLFIYGVFFRLDSCQLVFP